MTVIDFEPPRNNKPFYEGILTGILIGWIIIIVVMIAVYPDGFTCGPMQGN